MLSASPTRWTRVSRRGASEMTTTLGLILGSAAVAALVSSLVNAIGNWLTKRADLERQDMELAFKMAELRHDQVVKVQEWHHRSGQPSRTQFWDPFVSVI